MPTAWIFDLDGTLAHNDGHRGWYGEDELRVGFDTAHAAVVKVARALLLLPFQERDTLIFMTGRSERCRAETTDWILRHLGLEDPFLLMRAAGDSRRDNIIKDELYETHVSGKYTVIGAFEDRKSISEVWRSKGIKVFHVGEPDANDEY